MSFKLINASLVFKGYVNRILLEKINCEVVVYINKSLIDTKSAAQHAKVVK